MQLTIPLATLKLMVEAVKEAIPKSPPQEVLTNFRLEAKNGLLTLTATDLKLWLIRREDCETIKEEGVIALNAKRFSDMVKSLKGEDVSIKASEGAAVVKCGKSKFNLPVINADNYPSMPQTSEGKTFAIATNILHEGIAATLKAVSDDEARPALQGVHIYEFDETLEGEDEPTHFLAFTGTDPNRGSCFKIVSPPMASLEITVPVRTLREVEHITQAEVEVSLVNGHIWFSSHSLIIISPLIQQPFPPVQKMLSQLRKQKLSGSVKCDRKELIESLKRVNILSENDIHKQVVDMLIEGEDLKFFSNVAGVGDVEESMVCDVGSGNFRSLFSPKRLLTILDTTRSKHVKLEAYSGAQQCMFVSPCDGTDHETFLMAIADMRRNKPKVEDDDED